MNIKQFKPLIGQYIAIIPEGNAVAKGVPLEQQIKSVKLLKVGRKNLLTTEGSYDMTGDLNNHNYGYQHFLSMEDAENHLHKNVWEREISELFRYGESSLTYEQVRSIYGIVHEEST